MCVPNYVLASDPADLGSNFVGEPSREVLGATTIYVRGLIRSMNLQDGSDRIQI